MADVAILLASLALVLSTYPIVLTAQVRRWEREEVRRQAEASRRRPWEGEA